MFTATFRDGGDTFRKVLDVVKDLIKEVTIEVGSAGISMQTLDEAHVALLEVTMPEGCFASIEATNTQHLGISIPSLHKVFKSNASHKLRCHWVYDEENAADHLDIRFGSFDEPHDTDDRFELKLMDLDYQKGETPKDLFHKLTGRLDAKKFQESIHDLSQFSETVSVSRVMNCLSFVAEGDEGKIQFPVKFLGPDSDGESDDSDESSNESSNVESHHIENMDVEGPDFVASYSTKYLSVFAKAKSLSERVAIRCDPEVPLMLQYGDKGETQLVFWLAPRCND